MSLSFLNMILDFKLRFSNSFLTLIYLFSLIVYLVRFNSINKRHFQTYMLTRVLPLTIYTKKHFK